MSNPLDSLKNQLLESGKNTLNSVPVAIRPAYDLAGLYAQYEMQKENTRLYRAIRKRAEKGVSWSQLVDLRSKVEKAFAEPVRLQGLIVSRKKSLAKLEADEAGNDKIIRAKELVSEAENELGKAIKEQAVISDLLSKAGVSLDVNSSK